jgi:hypothetical protein
MNPSSRLLYGKFQRGNGGGGSSFRARRPLAVQPKGPTQWLT